MISALSSAQCRAWSRSAAAASSRAVHCAASGPARPASLRRARSAKCSACLRRTSGPVPETASRPAAKRAHRVQHAEPVLLAAPGDHQPGGIHQAADQPRQVRPGARAGVAADRPRIVQREGPGEHAQLGGEPLFRGLQQVVAGLDHIHQAAATGLPVPRQLLIEQDRALLQDLLDGQGAHPAGDQLDGQRQPVQPAAQLADGVRGDVGGAQAGQPVPGPGQEQLHGVRGRHVSGAGRGGRAVQRRHGPADLAGRAQHDPAGHHDTHPGIRADQLGGERGDRVPQVLRAVQQEQPRRFAQRGRDGFGQRHPGLVRDVQPAGDRREERAGLVHGLQRDEDDVGRRGMPADGLHRQPGLARPARAGEAEQPGPAQQPGQLGRVPARGR